MTAATTTVVVGETKRTTITVAVEVVFRVGHSPSIDIARIRLDGSRAGVLRLFHDAHHALARTLVAARDGRRHEEEVSVRGGRCLRFRTSAREAIDVQLFTDAGVPLGSPALLHGREVEHLREALVVVLSEVSP